MHETITKPVRHFNNPPEYNPTIIYCGNLCKLQGIPFLLECLKANKNRENCNFVVPSNKTKYPKIERWVVTLFQQLSKTDYDKLANAFFIGFCFYIKGPLSNNMAYLPVKSGRLPNIKHLMSE